MLRKKRLLKHDLVWIVSTTDRLGQYLVSIVEKMSSSHRLKFSKIKINARSNLREVIFGELKPVLFIVTLSSYY